jgi:hypothetical protein
MDRLYQRLPYASKPLSPPASAHTIEIGDYGTGSAQTRRYAATDIDLGVDILFTLAALVSCIAVAGRSSLKGRLCV